MPENILTIEELTKKYKDKRAVNRVSLTLNRGDIYGLVGSCGAGKTTLLRLVCGLTKPTEGSFSLFGVRGERQQQKERKRVGAMVEESALYRELTALENLLVQSRYFRCPVSEEEMQELLVQVGLEGVAKKPVGAFTRGMKRQLGVALTLVGKPDFVILDEPYLEVEDEKTEQIRQLLLRLNRERGLTILFSSVTPERLPDLVARYGFLHGGRLVRELRGEQCRAECEQRRAVKENEALLQGQGGGFGMGGF